MQAVCTQCKEASIDACYSLDNTIWSGDFDLAVWASSSRCVIVGANATLDGSIFGTESNDCVIVYGSVSGTVHTRGGDDCLLVDGGTILNVDSSDVALGEGTDYVWLVNEASVVGSVDGGSDYDSFVVWWSSVGGTIAGNGGYDVFDVCASSIDGATVNTGATNECVSISYALTSPIAVAGAPEVCMIDDSAVFDTTACAIVEPCSVPTPAPPTAARKRQTSCEFEADIVIALDHSQSIAGEYNNQKQAIASLIDSLNPTNATIHVGTVAYATLATLSDALSGDEAALVASVSSLGRSSQGLGPSTNTEAAIALAHSTLLATGRPGRDSAWRPSDVSL